MNFDTENRKYWLLILVIIIGVGLDQLTKLWVVQAIPPHSVIKVITGFFNLVHIYNRGAAFGLLSNLSTTLASLFFVFTTLIILGVLSYLYWRLSREQILAAIGYSLIMSGALGNLIDRIRLGEVIDFLDFYLGRHHWPAFNVADSLICVGAGFLFLAIWRAEGEANVSHPV
jgi:signal peptidase II